MKYYNNFTPYKLTSENGFLFYSFVDPLPLDLITPKHDRVVSIDWNYEGQLPDQNLMLLFKIYENLLRPIFDAERHISVFTFLGDGNRELCFYTDDYDAFMQDLNDCLNDTPRLPISIESDHDPDWNYYNDILDRVKEKGTLIKAA